jgi:ABC-type lipoprotein release transport system permease subunit
MWALALKNVYRDRRRSGATVGAFAAGMLGLVLFLGYVRFIESTLSDVVIYQQGNGHVVVYRHGGLTGLASQPAKFSIPAADYQRIRQSALALPGVVLVTPQMEGSGIIHNGDRTTVFLATGVEPAEDVRLRARGLDRRTRQTAGPGFAPPPSTTDGALLTPQLEQILQIRDRAETSRVQLSALAFDRRLNAEDAGIAGEFRTGIEETESKSLKLPLSFMQRLYRTDTVSRIVVLLEDRTLASDYARQLREKLRGLPEYDVYTWKDGGIAKIYDSFITFFGVVFAFTGAIVLAICVLTVQSTIVLGMLDRMRELGTLRSVGFGRVRLARLIAREGALLASAGGLLGIVLAGAAATALSQLHVTTTLPRMSEAVLLEIEPGLPLAIGAVALGGFLATAFSYATARRRIPTAVRDCFHLRLLCIAMVALVGLPASSAVAAEATSMTVAATPSPEELVAWIRTCDKARGGYGEFTWDLRIESRDGSERSDTSYRVDVKGDKALAYTLSPPSNKGEAILINGHSMWFMKTGLRRPVSISPRQRLAGEAANGDIASAQYADNYTPVLLGEATLDGRRAHKVRLDALHKDVTYDKVIYYVDAATHLALKAEFLTPSGMPLKQAVMTYENRVSHQGERWIISSMVITDSKYPDRSSVLTYSNVRWIEHPANRFTLAGLTE